MTRQPNIILDKSFAFAVTIIETYKTLTSESKEFVLSKQLLRSGTSIGANAEEAVGGYTKKDFKYKMGIAYKEARETMYWLKLLKETRYILAKDADRLIANCEELLRILWKIIKSSE